MINAATLMRKIAALIVCAFVVTSAHGEPYAPTDGWGGRRVHMAYSGLIGAAGNAYGLGPWHTFGACAAVGLTKEAWDFHKPSPGTRHGLFSRRDLISDAVGCALGYAAAGGVRYVFTGRFVGVSIPIQ